MKMTNRELETRYMVMKHTWKTLVESNVSLVDENKDLKEESRTEIGEILQVLEKVMKICIIDGSDKE